MPLPNDFRALAKAPMPPPGVGGNPMQVSGSKLQENFEYLEKNGGGSSLPFAQAGDMLYHNGLEFEAFSVPSAPGTGKRFVLHHDGAEPSWVLYDEITVDICVDGTPTSYTILGIPTV